MGESTMETFAGVPELLMMARERALAYLLQGPCLIKLDPAENGRKTRPGWAQEFSDCKFPESTFRP